MTIAHVAVSDSGATVRAKINAAIDAANDVPGKADAASLAAEVTARINADTSEANARALADEAEADARARADNAETLARTQAITGVRADMVAGDAAVVAHLAPAIGYAGHFGEMALFATGQTGGRAEDVPPLVAGAYEVSPLDGAVVVLTGAATVAPIALTRIEPGRAYRARFVLRRVEDTADPDGDGVRLALRWHSPLGVALAPQVLDDLLGVEVASGRLEFAFTFALADDGQVDVVAPAGGFYVRPYIQTFGSGVTHAVLAQIEDITGAVDWSPDVSAFRNAVAGVAAGLGVAQDELADLQERVTAAEARASQSAYQQIATDADFTVSFGSSAKVLRHTGTLTAARRAILATTDALEGQTARIVRTGGGSFPLNVRNGPTTLKAMASGSWAEFTFDGTGWFLSASGTL